MPDHRVEQALQRARDEWGRRHSVHVAVVDSSGRLVAQAGDPEYRTFWRSAAKPFQAIPGHTYHCDNDLDMAGGTLTITVTDKATGQVTKLLGVANVSQLTTKAKDKFIIDMAFPEDVVTDEVPGYGWTFANVQIQAYTR